MRCGEGRVRSDEERIQEGGGGGVGGIGSADFNNDDALGWPIKVTNGRRKGGGGPTINVDAGGEDEKGDVLGEKGR